MGPAASTASGILVGLIVFLAMAVTGVVAVNGANNPGISPVQESAAAGASAQMEVLKEDSTSLRSLDLNGDGRLSLAEAAGHADIVTRFDRADRNKDGKLTPREFDRLAKLPPPKAPRKKQPRRSKTTGSG